ncbi:hypothetical protein FJT64_001884 [Amphibalanus amphitrite]|uniref:Uncharacterized protein n=1 Tax=Amphibalanus amphitrite TaxID=1232801 RepID=A0A6A4WU57_AMPAM|nr:hypothetical protein FJT64_001884 [Amphibalanus amphitrite]
MTASAAAPYEGRSAPAGVDDETLVMLVGVLNLAGLFLYSAYNFVQDRPRLRSTYDRYVDAQVRRVLDDLVMRVHQTAYFSGLLETARSAGRGFGDAVPYMDFDRLEALSEDFPFPAAPGRQLAWLKRLNVTRSERTTLAGTLPLLSALRRLPAGLRRALRELAQPQPALAGHQQRAYAGLVRLASSLHWASGGTSLDGRQLRFFKSKWRKKPLTAKQEALLRRKIGLDREDKPWEDAEDEDTLPPPEDGYGEVWTGSHWTDRWYQLASQVTPVLLDAGNGYALSRRRPHCLPAVVCRLNRDWQPHGAVKASLSPLASLLLGWWLQDLGAGITLEDTLVAVRAGWMQRSCSDLYPHCHAVRGSEPPPDLITTTSTTVTSTGTSTTPAAGGSTEPPHGFFWALSSLLKNPVPRPPRPVGSRPPPPPPPPPTTTTPSTTTSTTTGLPPEIVGRLPPAPPTGEEPLAALEPHHLGDVDWGGAPPIEPPPEVPTVHLGWDRHQAVAWNRLDVGGSGGPPWDQFGGHGGKPIRGRPREAAGAAIDYRRPDQWPEQRTEFEREPVQPQQTEQWSDEGTEQSIDQQDRRPDHRPEQNSEQRPHQRPEHDPEQAPHQRIDPESDHGPEPDDSASAPSDQDPAASADRYQGGHLIPGSLSSGDGGAGRLPGALLALRRRPYRPSRRGYISEYGSDVLSGVQQSYAAGGAAPTEAAATTFRPGLVLDAPAPVREQQHQQSVRTGGQLLPGRYRLGLRRGLPSGGAQGVLPAYAERRRGLPPVPSAAPVIPATSPAPRHRWLPPPTAAPSGGERRRTWVQFGPQDGVTDAEKHRNLFNYVRDRSVRRLWGLG